MRIGFYDDAHGGVRRLVEPKRLAGDGSPHLWGSLHLGYTRKCSNLPIQ